MRKSSLGKILPHAHNVIIAIDRKTHLANPGSVLIQTNQTEAEREFATQVEEYCDEHIRRHLAEREAREPSGTAYVHVFNAIDYMLGHSLTLVRGMIKRRHWFLDRKSARCSSFRNVDAAVAEENRDGRLQQLRSFSGARWEYEDFAHHLMGTSTARTIQELNDDVARLKALLDISELLEKERAGPAYRTAEMLKDCVGINNYDTITVIGSSPQAIELIQSNWKVHFEPGFEELVFTAEHSVSF